MRLRQTYSILCASMLLGCAANRGPELSSFTGTVTSDPDDRHAYVVAVPAPILSSLVTVLDPPDGPPPGWTRAAWLYFPNRFLDFFDIARLGVEFGPGVGIDLMVTDHLRFGAMKRWSLGIGLQTLRHDPYKEGDEEYVEFGPVAWTHDITGYPWYIDHYDVRAELHVLVVGAHVAVNPAEIFDFFAGFAFVDFRDDDMH